MIIRLLAATGTVAAALVLTSCSGGAAATAPPAPAPQAAAPSSAAASVADEENAVKSAFTQYDLSLLRRDFTASCAALTEEARTTLLKGVQSKGLPAQSCEQAYTAVYSNSQAATLLDKATGSISIKKVTVNGDEATISYTGAADGTSSGPLSIGTKRVDGKWLIGMNQ